MDKKQLCSRAIAILKRRKYEVFKINSNLFDLYARKNQKSFLFKVLVDAISLNKIVANDLRKLAFIINAKPYIISEKYKGKEIGISVYYRYEIPVISLEYLNNFFDEEYIVKTYSEIPYFEINSEEIRKLIKDLGKSLSTFAEELGICKSTLIKYLFVTKRVPIDIALKLKQEYGLDLKTEKNAYLPELECKDEISKKLSELGAFPVLLEKFKPKIFGKLDELKFGIIDEKIKIENVLRFSRAVKMKLISLDYEYNDKNIISIKRKEFFNLSKEDLECLLN